MIIDKIVQIFGSLFGALNSPLATIIILAVSLLAVGGTYLYVQIRPMKKVLYFSEEEHSGIEMKVDRTTPAHLYTKKKGKKGDKYRFVRFRDAYSFQIGWKTVTRWLGKRGTAFTKKLEGGVVGEFTLWTIMKAVWGEEVCEKLLDEQKQKLIESEVMITVRLEDTLTPANYKDRSELFIKEESNQEMAAMFGKEMSREFNKEDWVRSGALILAGVALAYVAQAMGLLAGVAV